MRAAWWLGLVVACGQAPAPSDDDTDVVETDTDTPLPVETDTDAGETDVPLEPLVVAINWPPAGTIWSLASPQRLQAAVEPGVRATLSWTSDLDGALGELANQPVALSVGRHRITVQAVSDEGRRGTATLDLDVQCTDWDLSLGLSTDTCTRQVQQVPLAADAFVDATRPDEVVGAEGPLRVEGSVAEAFLRFDLSALPAGATIDEVALVMWASDAAPLGGRQWTDVHLVEDDAWPEALTWNTRPSSAADPLGSWLIFQDDVPTDQQVVLHAPAFQQAVRAEVQTDGVVSLRVRCAGCRVTFYGDEGSPRPQAPRLVVQYSQGDPAPGLGDVTPLQPSGIQRYLTARRWEDGTYARACWDYRRPADQTHAYTGDIGSGNYAIDPDGEEGRQPFEVWCDMETDGGGWTLVDNDAVPAEVFTDRTPGANPDPTRTRGALLPDYAWWVEPQVLCRADPALADETWVTLRVFPVAEGLVNAGLGYPTGQLPASLWTNGMTTVELNGLARSNALLFAAVASDPSFRAQADNGLVCACNDANGANSGIGAPVAANASTCSVWVR